MDGHMRNKARTRIDTSHMAAVRFIRADMAGGAGETASTGPL
jgi:hypothetical protein